MKHNPGNETCVRPCHHPDRIISLFSRELHVITFRSLNSQFVGPKNGDVPAMSRYLGQHKVDAINLLF